MLTHPGFQIGDQRRAQLLPNGPAPLGALAADASLDLEQGVYPADRFQRQGRDHRGLFVARRPFFVMADLAENARRKVRKVWPASAAQPPSRALCQVGCADRPIDPGRPSRRLHGGASTLVQLSAEQQHHRQKTGPGPAASNHMERRKGLADLLAITASKFLPEVLNHLPGFRDHLQRLGDVLAEPEQPRATTAGAGDRSRHDHPLARQMLRERLA